MIYKDISDIILKQLNDDSKVLDVGGGKNPWFRATHIIDKRSFEEQLGEPLHSEGKLYYTKETWLDRDFFEMPWPYPDKYFDFCICADTLEDIRDPIAVAKEIQRVSKAGYICDPTRAAESYIGGNKNPLSAELFGYFHHRWFVEIVEGGMQFTMKTPLLYQHPQWLVKEVGQKTLNFFWKDSFKVYEHYVNQHDDALADLETFFGKHAEWVKNYKEGSYDPDRYNHWVEAWGVSPEFQKLEGIME